MSLMVDGGSVETATGIGHFVSGSGSIARNDAQPASEDTRHAAASATAADRHFIA